MQTRLVLKPGQRGTIRLVKEYGDRLLCVRYRYDVERQRRLKTVELIVSETPWDPPAPIEDLIVALKIAWGERDLAAAVKRAGGRWDTRHRVWRLARSSVLALGLQDRVVSNSLLD
jgi:hypothetical protein